MTGRAALAWMLGVMLLANIGCGLGRREPSAGKDSVFQTLATRKQIDGLSREQLAGKQLFLHYCAVCHAETFLMHPARSSLTSYTQNLITSQPSS